MKIINKRKADIWISTIIYILIVVAVVVIVLQAGVPMFNKLKEKAVFTKGEDNIQALNQHLGDVASEGTGSQRIVPVEFSEGTFSINPGSVMWELKTTSKIIEPRTKIEKGNLIVSSGINVNARDAGGSFIVENPILLVNFSKTGNDANWSSINTNSLVNYIEFKANNARPDGTFNFMIGNDQNSAVGAGYSRLLQAGSRLSSSGVLVHINSTDYEYDFEIVLESDADFLKTNIVKFYR